MHLTFVHLTRIIYTDSSFLFKRSDFSTSFRSIMATAILTAYLSSIALLLLYALARQLQVLFCRHVLDRAHRRVERMHRRKAKRLPERLQKRYLRSVGL